MNQEGLNSLGGSKNKIITSSIVALLLCCIAIFIISITNHDVPSVSEQKKNDAKKESAISQYKNSEAVPGYLNNIQEDSQSNTQDDIQSDAQTNSQVSPQNNTNNQAATNFRCTDSDGGKNYYKRGSAVMYNAPEFLSTGTPRGVIFGENMNACSSRKVQNYQDVIAYDCCVNSTNSNQLNESYCEENGEESFIPYACPNGCKDGVCIQKVRDNCIDSDGGYEPYKLGTVFRTDAEGKKTEIKDVCIGSNVMEGICDSNGYTNNSRLFECPNGCENGSCKN